MSNAPCSVARLVALCVSLLLLSPRSQAALYHEQVLTEGVAGYWRFSDGAGETVSDASGNGLHGVVEGRIGLGQPGPRPGAFPDFEASNRAGRFGDGRGFVRIADPGAESPIDFALGDSLTIEAWLAPDAIPDGRHFYVVGKGRTLNKGVALNNQNFALRLTGEGGEGRISFLFRDHRNRAEEHWHRWTSVEGPLGGSGWHHVAVAYTFGNGESVRGYVDGREVEGRWDMGGRTSLAPVVDDDEIWIGASMGGGSGTFHGLIDEVAIHRRLLGAGEIGARFRYLPPEVVRKEVPAGRVMVELYEGIPDRASWQFTVPGIASDTYFLPAFGFAGLPSRYLDGGIREDWGSPLLLRAWGRVSVGEGQRRFLVRSRGGSRLWVDGHLTLTTPFPTANADGHESVPEVTEPLVSGMRYLQPGDAESSGVLDLSAGEHLLMLETLVGGKGRRMELGELSVSLEGGDGMFRLVSPAGAGVALTDAEWEQYEREGRLALREQNRRRRAEAGSGEAAYWEERHLLARSLVAGLEVAVPSGSAANPVDRFLDAVLAAGGVEPSARVDDWSFLRRASLDITGVPPSPEQIRAFEQDAVSGRRQRAVDRLLGEERWADHWVSYWQDVLAENPGILKPKLNNTGPFRWFIHESFLDNKPMDRFAAELIMMEGSTYDGGAAGFALATENDVPMAAKAQVLAQAFMGMQLSCARCHDAPYHDFDQKDLFSLAAMLKREPERVPASSSIPEDSHVQIGRLVEVTLKPGSDVEPVWPFAALSPGPIPKPMLRREHDSREELAARITHPLNSRFARVIVNRVWKRYMGRGIVEPVDDWENAKPSHPGLLDFLAHELVIHGYDLKHVARLILTSEAYQRRVDVRGVEEAGAGPGLFASPPRRRMSAEQVVDSLFAVAGKSFGAEALTLDVDGRRPARDFLNLGRPERAWEFASLSNERDRPALAMPKAQPILDALTVFGWRESRQNPVSVRDDSPNVLQPATLSNGLMAARICRLSDDHAVTGLCLEEIPLEELVQRLFLRFYTRPASAVEVELISAPLREGYDERRLVPSDSSAHRTAGRRPVSWSNHLSPEATLIKQELEREVRAGDPPTDRLRSGWRERMEDVIWALVNSPEFVFVP